VSRARGLEASALLLRKIDYGEADLVLQMLTDTLGRVGVIARFARASKRRFAGGVEPIHSLRIVLDEPEQGELYRLRESRPEVPRLRLVTSLTALNVAGKALTWVRETTVVGAKEPGVFSACTRLLDALDHDPPQLQAEANARLAEFGLLLLTHLGWALELERCVRCGRNCPSVSPATVDPRQGGLVCRRCGGAMHLLDAGLRQRMIASSRGASDSLYTADAATALAIVEATLSAHPGITKP
jgi:DNA repair protein RecO (recombination protein O)